jgi:cytochrome c-type biogenesis protein CcmH
VKSFAAALAILALIFGLAFAFRSGNGRPTQAEMEADLVCTTCHEPLDESDSPLAQQMKAEIRRQIAAGWSKDKIENYFVAALGPQVLAVPRSHGFDLLAWLLPLAGIVAGAAAVAAGARAWSKNRGGPDAATTAAEESALSPALERRVDAELAQFES